MDTSCYKKAVGLSRCICPCTSDLLTEQDNLSESGLYITDLAPFSGLDGLDDCNTPGNPWEVLQSARNEAILMFMSDASAMLMSSNKIIRESYTGFIGEDSSRDVVTPPGTHAGLRIRCAPVKAGTFFLEKVGGVFNQTGQIELRIFSRENLQLGSIYTLPVVAGRYSEVEVGIELPMNGNFEAQEYYIVYQVGPNLPRATRSSCGCGGFDPRLGETFRTAERGSRAWSNWLQIGGWTGNNLTDFDLSAVEKTGTNITYGLSIKVRLNCNVGHTICGDELNFASPLAMSIAQAIYYKSAEIVADKIMASSNLNRYSLINRDNLREDRAKWRRSYAEIVSYVSSQVDVSQSGCLMCKHPISVRTAPVLS